MKPPIAPRIEHSCEHHGIVLEDPYHWLKDPGYPDVTQQPILDYLRQENAYFDARFKPYQPLVDNLFAEIKGRQPREDESVPYRKGHYWYRWRFEADAQYRIWERARVTSADTWQVMLDEPALAQAHRYFTVGGLSVSPDGRYLAWSADTSGGERFTLTITDLQTGIDIDEQLSPTQGSPVWARDSRHLFYLKINDNWRPYQVLRHELGTRATTDVLLYEEPDDGFFVGLDETQSEQWIVVSSGDHVTSELHVLPAADPTARLRCVAPRQTGREYDLDHRDGHFYIRSNDEHANFRLVRTPDTTPGPESWQPLIEGSDEHYLTGHLCLRDYLVICERVEGIDNLRVIDNAGASHDIRLPEEVRSVDLGVNAEFATSTLRLVYESPVTPVTVFDYDIGRRELHPRKVQQIPSGYDASQYRAERLTVTARDGARVPVTLVYHSTTALDGSAPLYLYGYGAYGHAIGPGFSPSRLSLLDRGFIHAIAHVRGGDDLGYHWYEAGKLDKRTNTFQDFVDVARFLAAGPYSRPGNIVIAGGSAGGELVAAAVNEDPRLFGAVVAHVPFVDVLNTMLDTSLPLTPIEWPEWGNPIEDQAAFEHIQSYSPYDQLSARDYPPMLVTAGLNDPRVTYWEPAKYVAKLRYLKTDSNWLLLKTNMDAGHRGQSGRFDALLEVAEEYAFVLVSLGREGRRVPVQVVRESARVNPPLGAP